MATKKKRKRSAFEAFFSNAPGQKSVPADPTPVKTLAIDGDIGDIVSSFGREVLAGPQWEGSMSRSDSRKVTREGSMREGSMSSVGSAGSRGSSSSYNLGKKRKKGIISSFFKPLAKKDTSRRTFC
eukprot:463684-Amorphochlora_amoeboformis.AAC.1